MKCVWCGSQEWTPYLPEWDQCRCGSLVNLHPDTTVYNETYYTHSERVPGWRLRWPLEALRGRLALIGAWPLRKPPHLYALARAGVKASETLLDWGCGSGMYVDLARCYGVNAVGWDPYGPRFGDQGVLSGRYDWVMFRHVLEHVRDPEAVIDSVDTDRLLVFLPCAGTPQAVREGADWDQLVPGHLHTPTISAAVAKFHALGWTLDDVWIDRNRQLVDGSSVAFTFHRA